MRGRVKQEALLAVRNEWKELAAMVVGDDYIPVSCIDLRSVLAFDIWDGSVPLMVFRFCATR